MLKREAPLGSTQDRVRFPWSQGNSSLLMSFSICSGVGKAGSKAEPFFPSLQSTKSLYCHYKAQFVSDAKRPEEQTEQMPDTECFYSDEALLVLFFLIIEQQSGVSEKGTSKHCCCQQSISACFPQGQIYSLILHNAAINQSII